MSKRVANFAPGPACLPEEVLKEAAAEMLDFAGTGKSVLESSHRSPEYDAVHSEAQALFLELLGLDAADYHVMFLGGGATTQFATLPMSFLAGGKTGDYILTGNWSNKAIKQAKFYGQTHVAATTEVDGQFTRIPRPEELSLTEGAAYVHLTSNNTIFGTQWKTFPEVAAPLIADMSSDFLSRKLDATKFDVIYAGAQKNLGPAGVTVVIMHQRMLDRCPELPVMFHYPTQAAKNSLSNTPPAFPIYLVGKVLKWLKAKGGVEAMEQENQRKGELLYGTIDAQPEFFRAPVEKDSRSLMNIVFRLPSEELEKRFIAEAKDQDMIGVKGYRTVGGIRISTYNACPYEWVERVTGLMRAFAKQHG